MGEGQGLEAPAEPEAAEADGGARVDDRRRNAPDLILTISSTDNTTPRQIGGAFHLLYPVVSFVVLTDWRMAVHPPSTGDPPACGQPLCSSQATLRHPMVTTYGCFLPDLTGFAGHRRAGPNLPHRKD